MIRGRKDSTGRKKYRLRAEVAGRPRKTPAYYNCCTDENGGIADHVIALTPMGGTDVKISGGILVLQRRSNAVRKSALTIGERPEGLADVRPKHSVTHVDACIETPRDRASMPAPPPRTDSE